MWKERFEQFSLMKEKQARQAKICGFITVADCSHGCELTKIDDPFVLKEFHGPFYSSMNRGESLPLVNAVFVQSKNGNTGAENPADLGGGETDKHIIYEGLSRVNVDAVLAGANSVRGSGIVLSVWHPEMVRLRKALGKTRHPAQAVVTESGEINMDEELLFNVPELPVFVLTTTRGRKVLMPHAKKRPWVMMISTGDHSDLALGLKILRKTGIESISVIGGRTVATSLIDAALIRDLYLTTAAQPGGEPNTPYYTGSRDFVKTLVVKKQGRGNEKGVIFEHFIVS